MWLFVLPVLLIAFLLWVSCSVLFVINIFRKKVASWWVLPFALLISSICYFLGVYSWADSIEVPAYDPYFVLPFSCVIAPGLFGVLGTFAPRQKRAPNIIGNSICLSAIIGGIALFFVPGLMDATTFLDVEITNPH